MKDYNWAFILLFCALHRKSPKFPILTNSHQLNSIYPNPPERKFKFIADFFTSSTSSSHQILISSIIPNKSQKSPDLSPYLPTNFKHACLVHKPWNPSFFDAQYAIFGGKFFEPKLKNFEPTSKNTTQ